MTDATPRGRIVDEQGPQRGRSVDVLATEFRGTFNRETVERLFEDSFLKVSRGKVTAFSAVLAERLTRDRLGALARVEGRSEHAVPSVLFLCVHNAGRSQMAAGWFRRLAGDRALVYSGGSEPADAINANAIEAMSEVGIDITTDFPKPWTEEIVQGVDVVVTMGCGDACPVVPGVRYVDWELDDPAGQSLDTVRRIRDQIEGRVRHLLDEVGVSAGGDA